MLVANLVFDARLAGEIKGWGHLADGSCWVNYSTLVVNNC
jgi:hypothetical protein